MSEIDWSQTRHERKLFGNATKGQWRNNWQDYTDDLFTASIQSSFMNIYIYIHVTKNPCLKNAVNRRMYNRVWYIFYIDETYVFVDGIGYFAPQIATRCVSTCTYAPLPYLNQGGVTNEGTFLLTEPIHSWLTGTLWCLFCAKLLTFCVTD